MRSTTSCDVAVKSGAQDLREAQARPVVRLTPAFFDAVCQPPLCGKDEMKYRALLQLHPRGLEARGERVVAAQRAQSRSPCVYAAANCCT